MMDFDFIQNCNFCGLSKNQKPLVDLKTHADIMWVGLSAVKVADVKNDIPLSTATNSGKLIDSIEKSVNGIEFYKTNLVKCLPIDNEKIRYPNINEMKACYNHLLREIEILKPNVIFLLGRKVFEFILKKEKKPLCELNKNFNYEIRYIYESVVIPVHHPSYILIYKRKLVDIYKESISKICVEFNS